MENQIARLAVLTSGGDAPGMNAAIRAVVRTAQYYGIECLGIRRGYNGLINSDIEEMDWNSVRGIINRGGTMLYTARCEEFMSEAGLKKAANTCKYLGIDGLIAIGGDGTFRGLADLSKYGVSTVGIPGTIDNDIACTQYSIGFDTACNTAIECVDRLRDTMQSHERCSVVEVMGRRAGHLALYVGIASGAAFILVPEKPSNWEKELVERVRHARIRGRTHFIVIVAEGAGHASEVAEFIEKETGIDTRLTVIGHIQRGGTPTARDRVTASRMGEYAVELLRQGKKNRIVAMVSSELCDFDVVEALSMKRGLQEEMYNTAVKLTTNV